MAMDVNRFRYVMNKGIDRALSASRWLSGIDDETRAALIAARDEFNENDGIASKIAARVAPYAHDTKDGIDMAQSLDFSALLKDLEDVMAEAPAVAALVGRIITDVKNILTPAVKAKLKGCGPCDPEVKVACDAECAALAELVKAHVTLRCKLNCCE